MEIVGGFMVMISMLGLFLAVVWLIMPFVVFAIKGKLDRSLDVLAGIEKRLTAIESQLATLRKPICNETVPEPPRSDPVTGEETTSP